MRAVIQKQIPADKRKFTAKTACHLVFKCSKTQKVTGLKIA